MKRLLIAVFALGCLSAISAIEVRFARALPTELGPGNILDTFLSEVTIEFVARDTLAVAYHAGVALIDVTDGSFFLLPVDPVENEFGDARYVLQQETNGGDEGVFIFREGPGRAGRPLYAYNIATGQLCDVNTAPPSERAACFGGLEHYFEVDSPWQDERAFATDFQLYRVNAVSGERALLHEQPMRDLFGRRSSRGRATLVDSVGNDRLMLLVGPSVDGVPYVARLDDRGGVAEVTRVEGVDHTRNAAFVGDSHAAVLVDGEVLGGEMVYEVAIVDFDGNRVAELEELRVFDMRQYLDVSADGRWLAVFGYHTGREEEGLFLYEIIHE